MATATVLEQNGVLFKLDAGLEPDEQELRLVHTSRRLMEWLRDDLPGFGSEWNIETSPLDQVAQFVADFGAGLPLTVGRQLKAFQRRPLQAVGDGVWYLKTADVRIFGWFWRKDCFIGAVADTAERCKTHRLYTGYRGEVIRFRDSLDLDQPKFIPGEDPDAIVSNYCFPD